MQSISFIIGADLVPTKSNFDLFQRADINILIGSDLFNVLNSADFRIFNLEVPLVDLPKPINKWGPNLSAPTTTISGIKAMNPSLLCLANNHILDQNVQGLDSTIKLLENYNIDFVGAGNNLQNAAKPYIFEKSGLKIGVYACAEHEFTIATEKNAGANPFDPFESFDHISSLKEVCDYIIVLYHGGKEHYQYPSPMLRKVCRKMVNKGADLVICQHSHCIGSHEEYNGSTIVYGQGNFIFDNEKNDLWHTSLLIKLNINKGLAAEFIPIVRVGNGIRLADTPKAEDILQSFYLRSTEIMKEGFIEQHYQKFAEENLQQYLRSISGNGKWFSGIDRKILGGIILKRKYDRQKLLRIQNYIECEAHRELFLAGLKKSND